MSSSPSNQIVARPAISLAIWLWRVAIYSLLLGYFVLGVGYLALRYHVWPNLDRWRPQVVEHLSQSIGRPVSIARISTDFDGWQPVVSIERLRIDGPQPLSVPSARAVVSLRTFLTWRLRLTELELRAPEFEISRSAEGRIEVAGFALGAASNSTAFDDFLAQRTLTVRDARIAWRDQLLGRSQNLAGVDLRMQNFGRRHKIDLQAERLGALAQHFELTAELFRAPGAPSNDWRQWSGDIYAAADHLIADAIASNAGVQLPFTGATGELRFWSRLEDARLNDVQLKLAGQSMRIDLPDAKPILVGRFGADASALRRGDGGYDWVVRRLFAQTDDGFALNAAGDQTLATQADGSLHTGQLSFDAIELAGALALIKRLPLPAKIQTALLPVKGRGRLLGLKANFTRREILEFDATLRFEQLSLVLPQDVAIDSAAIDAGQRPPLKLPSLENVSGSARIKHDRGEMSFEGKNSALTFPGLFEQARIALDSVNGKVQWQTVRSGGEAVTRLNIEQLAFANSHAAGDLRGSYQSAPSGPGIVDLRGNLSRGDATQVARYLPVYVPKNVRQWVGESIAAGKISRAQFKLRGDLLAFPFRDPRDGEFLIEGSVQDGRLDYAPEWPKIEQFQGVLRFAQGGMNILMNQGRLYGVALSNAQARIEDFRQPLLTIEGQGRGPAQDMIRFVNESPVRSRIDDFTRDTRAEGVAALQLKLELPLENLKASRVKGTVLFENNDLRLDATIPKFEQVAGRLQFSQDGLALNGITATFLGGPLQVDGQTADPGRMLIKARGTMTAQNMRSLVDNPLTAKLTGQTDYRASVDVNQRAAKLTIESDLRGLASDLPEPFNKPADVSWPLLVVSTPTGVSGAAQRATGDLIDVTLNEKVKLVFARGRDPKTEKLLIERGAFAYDAPAVLADQGFVVLVNRRDLNLDRWLDILSAAAQQTSSGAASTEFAAGFSLLPDLVSVVSDQINVAGKTLHDVVFGASRTGGFWRANISAREINGYFNWREARAGQRIGALSAHFSRLEIPSAQRGAVESLIESAPQELPSLDISVDELVLADRSLGKLTLRASSGGTEALPAWYLNSLRIENPAAVLNASGVWAPPRDAMARRTQLDYRLDVADAGELLTRFGMNNLVKGGAGALEGKLGWNGSPMALHYESLSGNTEIKLGKGQFLKAEPGLAKLIGVLNLQFLPRRLSLDFNDVFAAGFSFDEIEGAALIAAGTARTDELLMKGVQARVRLKGEVDLSQETQRLEVEVKPELNAGLASLAYAALANPAVGLTTFIAQTLLRRPLEEIFTYNYDVSGTWADPQVLERRREPAAPSPHLP